MNRQTSSGPLSLRDGGETANFDDLLAASSLGADFAVRTTSDDDEPVIWIGQVKHTSVGNEDHSGASAVSGQTPNRLWADLVFRYAHSRLTDAKTAEEVTADVLARAASRLRRGDITDADVGPLLVRLARQTINQRERTIKIDLRANCASGKTMRVADLLHCRTASPDPVRSRAVVIGASHHGSAPSLPGAETSASSFAKLLPEIGVPIVTTLLGHEATAASVLEALNAAAAEATDTLILHFAGHGSSDPDGRLVLGTADTYAHHPGSGLRYSEMHTLIRRSPTKRSLVILDACQAGLVGRELHDRPLPERRVSGSDEQEMYVMASTGPDGWSLDRTPDEQSPSHTAFTGALLNILTHGAPGGGAELDVVTVFSALDRRLRQATLPRPHLYHSGCSPHLLTLGRNPRARRCVDMDAAARQYTTALALCRQIGDRDGQAAAVSGLGAVAVGRGDMDAAARHYTTALETFTELGADRNVAVVRQILTRLAGPDQTSNG